MSIVHKYNFDSLPKQVHQAYRHLLDYGSTVSGRNGLVISDFDYPFRFDTKNEFLPLSNLRKFNLRNTITEFRWMIRGDTNIKYLNDNGCHYWDKFADENGEVGKTYGYQLRKFNGCIDQLEELIAGIKTFPESRRHIITLWNPAEVKLDNPNIPPCIVTLNFTTTHNCINLMVSQRSCDALIGLPSDFIWYGLLLFYIGEKTQYNVGYLTVNVADFHVYTEHYETLEEIANMEFEAGFYNEKLPFDKRDYLADNSGINWGIEKYLEVKQ